MYSFLLNFVYFYPSCVKARPEQYRCKNSLDERFGAKFGEHAFASTNTKCRKWNFDWESSCPNATTAGDYQSCDSLIRSNDLTCSKCEEFVYSSNNTFTQTVIRLGVINFPCFYLRRFFLSGLNLIMISP